MRAVVTGGAGFIGSHLIEALVARGDTVTCVERPGAPRGWLEGLELAYHAVGLRDVDVLARLFHGADAVFHLAGLTEARTPRDFYAVNTDGTDLVVRAAAAHNGRAPRVILMSSIAALGPNRNGDLLAPDTVPHPISHYGRSKLLAEAVLHAYADRVPGTIIRLSSVYGPRERGVLKLFQLVRRGVALTVGGWDREVSLIYVKDVVQGLLAAATAERAAGRTYCLSHPAPITWREFALAVGSVMNRAPRLVSVPVALAQVVAVAGELAARVRNSVSILNRERVRDLAQSRWVCDATRAMTEIGFQPAYELTRGVGETAAWYRAAGWL
ncbi:MAG TPA: NAD(P)-dependent oxidoreductase [Gemmatimonadales bacterium]